MDETAARDEVIAFRLASHHLDGRLGERDLLTAAGACGIQNSPPGSGLTALYARVEGMSRERLDSAVAEDRTLLQSWCMRGAPFYFPTSDLDLFTAGVLPRTEKSLRHFVLGVERSVDDLGVALGELVTSAEEAIDGILRGQRMTITELGEELARAMADSLTVEQRKIWVREGPYAKGQSLGEGVVHFCIRILTLRQILCFAPRDGNTAPFVLVDEWLDRPKKSRQTDLDPSTIDAARADLLRRYLHCYGPSTRADFAAWLGIRSTEAAAWWDLLEGELTEIRFGRKTWMLTEDVDALHSVQMPRGVRLLPPRDPYTQMRDRETIVDKVHHSTVWKTVGEPGAVLVDGRIAGTWRGRKKNSNFTVTFSLFDTVQTKEKRALTAEAEAIGALRQARRVDVEFDD